MASYSWYATLDRLIESHMYSIHIDEHEFCWSNLSIRFPYGALGQIKTMNLRDPVSIFWICVVFAWTTQYRRKSIVTRNIQNMKIVITRHEKKNKWEFSIEIFRINLAFWTSWLEEFLIPMIDSNIIEGKIKISLFEGINHHKRVPEGHHKWRP